MTTIGRVSTLRPWVDPDVTLFDFARMAVNDPRLTFTGGAGRTYYDDSRVMRAAAANEMRFERGPDGLRYLKTDPQATNLVTQSANPASWTTTRAVMSENRPWAGLTMSKCMANAENNGHHTNKTVAKIDEGVSFSVQIALKPAEIKYARLTIWSGQTPSLVSAVVNLITGETGTSACKAEPLADGVWIFSFPGLVSTSGATVTQVRAAMMLDPVTEIFVGNNSDGFWVGGAQIETGAVCTSFIPTGASAATRAPEACNLLGQDFLNAFNPVGWCVMVDSSTPAAPTSTVGIVNVYNPAVAGRLYQGITAPGASIAALTPPTGSQINIGTRGAIYLGGARVKTAAGYDGATYRSAVNGVAGNAPTAAAAVIAADRMAIASLTGLVNWTHKIYSVRIYRRAVPINEMTQATMQ